MKELQKISNNARKKILSMKHYSKSSHIGSAFSVLDILVYLYFKGLNIAKENLNDNNRDRLILSKGHASAAIYTTLALKGFLDYDKLDKYYCDDGELPGHIDMTVSDALDLSAGSLGHGLSVGAGMALAMRIDAIENRIVVIMGDGEINEGSIWEAAMFITRENLKNITIFIDCNKFQGYDETSKILTYDRNKNMWLALGYDVLEVDGHNFYEIETAFNNKSERPFVILANTIKGKGVSYMENKLEWHYKSPSLEELRKGLEELEENNL